MARVGLLKGNAGCVGDPVTRLDQELHFGAAVYRLLLIRESVKVQ
jgi:hypothetical protein